MIPAYSRGNQNVTPYGEKRNGSDWCSAVEASQITFYYTGLRTPDVIPFLIWRPNQEAQFFR